MTVITKSKSKKPQILKGEMWEIVQLEHDCDGPSDNRDPLILEDFLHFLLLLWKRKWKKISMVRHK